MTSLTSIPRKRLHDGQIKLEAYNQDETVDLTVSSDEEKESFSKRPKSTSLGPGLRPSLPFHSGPPPSSDQCKPSPSSSPLPSAPNSSPRPSTPARQSSANKPRRGHIFKSPPWQDKKVLKRDEGSAEPIAKVLAIAASPKAVTKVSHSPNSWSSRKPIRSASDSVDSAEEYSDNRGNRPARRESTRVRATGLNPLRASRHRDDEVSEEATRRLRNRNLSIRRSASPDRVTTSRSIPRPTIIVQIDKPATLSPDSAQLASRSLLAKFSQSSKAKYGRRVAEKALTNAQRKSQALVSELKKDASLVCSRALSVEAVVGSHGLCKHYDDTEALTKRMLALAQPKARKVQRSKVTLNWGVPPTNVSIFNREDVIFPVEQIKTINNWKLRDTKAPLEFSNNVNDRQIPGKLQFVEKYVAREGCKLPVTQSGGGCSCVGSCEAAASSCHCQQDPEGKQLVFYRKREDGLVVLNPKIMGGKQEIYECNDACHCGRSCINRVVQRGRTIPLEIFMTPNRGFGLRSPKALKKGEFIDVYWGELLNEKQVTEDEEPTKESTPSYVFSLDFFQSAIYHIQGLHFGSPARFINHSCNPNARSFAVMTGPDKRIHNLAYFAIKGIPPYTEITFDYSPDMAEEEHWVPLPSEEDTGVLRCCCGEANCRGRVWPMGKSSYQKKGEE